MASRAGSSPQLAAGQRGEVGQGAEPSATDAMTGNNKPFQARFCAAECSARPGGLPGHQASTVRFVGRRDLLRGGPRCGRDSRLVRLWTLRFNDPGRMGCRGFFPRPKLLRKA